MLYKFDITKINKKLKQLQYLVKKMISPKAILSELDQLEALADTVKDKCVQLREKLGVVSTTPTTRKGKYAASKAKVLANLNKTMLKKK